VTDVADLARRLRSKDPNEAGLALGDLTALGSGTAAPVLVEAARDDDADTRVYAMEGLATLADPGTEDTVRQALDDPDGRVRAGAAAVLNRLGASDALDALAATLDDWPDLLHGELSRSAYELAGCGEPALRVAVPLLASADWTDRAKGAFITRQVAEQGALDDLAAIVAGYDGRDERPDVADAARRWLEAR